MAPTPDKEKEQSTRARVGFSPLLAGVVSIVPESIGLRGTPAVLQSGGISRWQRDFIVSMWFRPLHPPPPSGSYRKLRGLSTGALDPLWDEGRQMHAKSFLICLHAYLQTLALRYMPLSVCIFIYIYMYV